MVEHALFDHLIRPQEERLRDREPERLGGLEVDYQLELSGLLTHYHSAQRLSSPQPTTEE